MNAVADMILAMMVLVPASAVGQVCVKQLNVPKYPALAWSAQWTGIVDLTMTIGVQGQVVSVEGSGSSPYLIEQAKANVKDWVFCAPVDVGSAHVRLRYDYRLEGARVYPPPNPKVVIDLGEAAVVITSHPPEPQP